MPMGWAKLVPAGFPQERAGGGARTAKSAEPVASRAEKMTDFA
jgi:hypothetical protein